MSYEGDYDSNADVDEQDFHFLNHSDSEDEDDPNLPAIFPLMGTFIRFSIDPVVTTEAVDDGDVKSAARAMKTKEYLGYVHRLCSLDVSQPYLIHDIVLIGRGLPKRNEDRGVEPDMCTPLFPTIYHPTGRKPLRTNKPFPFENCYTHSYVSVARVRIKTELAPYVNAIALPSMEHIRDEALAIDDQDRRDELRVARQEPLRSTSSQLDLDLAQATVPLQLQESGGGVEGVAGPRDVIERVHTFGEGDEESQDLELDIPNVMAAIMAQGVPDENLTAVTNVSYDLSGLEGFGQPDEFFEEEAYLKRLISDSKAKAIDRAREIDEEAYGRSKTPIQPENEEPSLESSNPNVRSGRLRRIELSLSNGWKRVKRWVLTDSP